MDWPYGERLALLATTGLRGLASVSAWSSSFHWLDDAAPSPEVEDRLVLSPKRARMPEVRACRVDDDGDWGCSLLPSTSSPCCVSSWSIPAGVFFVFRAVIVVEET